MSVKDAIKERTDSMIKEPRHFNVIMLNDDFTTMDFVVGILKDIFHKDEASAEAIMMDIHKNGKAIVGRYPYDIAVTKVNTAINRARAKGFPFMMKIEEA